MSPEIWRVVQDYFHRALELPPAGRGAWLAAHCPDEQIRAEVLSLLDAHEEEPAFLEGGPSGNMMAALSDALDNAAAAISEGAVVGPYRLLRQIGRGGMSTVFEAARIDGEVERHVAVKFFHSALLDPALHKRFLQERQLLAQLEHPSIARLYDAGTTTDGRPYLVMELIQGKALDDYARAVGAPVERRVQLMLHVCAAVEYAHRNLVVHRDLKPANILVTNAGDVKLLDFGIAKVISEAPGIQGITQPGAQWLTPDYASPEQIRGDAITTSADVYSLGALLFTLLAGMPPFASKGATSLSKLMERLEREPGAPSGLSLLPDAKRIRGDLDNIVLRCLRPDPDERYPSARAFADDLTAWLEGLPVSATKASAWYRARKFYARRKFETIAVGSAAIAVVGLGIFAGVQAGIARHERDKATENFLKVSEFSRGALFDVDSEISRVPGTTKARSMLLGKTLELYDGLAQGAAGNLMLQLELAEGYRKLGNVQGLPTSANLGDQKAAKASYDKALRLAEQAMRENPQSADAQAALVQVVPALARLDIVAENRAGVKAGADRLRAEVARMEQLSRNTAAHYAIIGFGHSELAFLSREANPKHDAKADYQRADEWFQRAAKAGDATRESQSQWAYVLKRWGALLIVEGKLDEARRKYQSALDVEESLLKTSPEDPVLRRALGFTLSDLALIEQRSGRLNEAMSFATRMIALRTRAVELDPNDISALRLLGTGLARMAYIARLKGDLDLALSATRRMVDARERELRMRPDSTDRRRQAMWSHLDLSRALLEKGMAPDAGPLRAALLHESVQWRRQSEKESAEFPVDAEYVQTLKDLKAKLPR